MNRAFRWPSQTEGGRAFLIWQLMRRISGEDNDQTDSTAMVSTYARAVTWNSNFSGRWRDLAERVLRLLFDYLGERVGKQVAYLLVINLSGRPLKLPSDDDPKLWPPRITVAGVRVYLIAVRALPPVATTSIRTVPARREDGGLSRPSRWPGTAVPQRPGRSCAWRISWVC
jgi:hypothetical protein